VYHLACYSIQILHDIDSNQDHGPNVSDRYGINGASLSVPKSSTLVLQQVKLSHHCQRITSDDPLTENEISLPGNVYSIRRAYCRLEGGNLKAGW